MLVKLKYFNLTIMLVKKKKEACQFTSILTYTLFFLLVANKLTCQQLIKKHRINHAYGTIKVMNRASRWLGLLPSCCSTANLLPAHLKSSLPRISVPSININFSFLGQFSIDENYVIEIAFKHHTYIIKQTFEELNNK